jgi:7-cyano-7-deazaguanine synthase
MSALVLLSGGLDSTVAAALQVGRPGGVRLGLCVDYGQRAARREAQAADAVGRALGFDVLHASLPLLAEVTATALVRRDRPLPNPTPESLDRDAQASADAVWVPNRNGLLVNLAAALAEARGLELVVVGFNAEEAETFQDNSERFVNHLNACLRDSTRARVQVVAPLLHLTKAQLVAEGRRVGAPMALAWSCYEGGEVACGRCESCRRRARAEG